MGITLNTNHKGKKSQTAFGIDGVGKKEKDNADRLLLGKIRQKKK